ncbi:hypothetical protein COLU111180_20935 [Cohnella lubricantis]|uniref:Uncharacterized protein n=1 Tax=Cohnella lubricantis TaxID=2163172 RepID=A0A841TL03_9BACL|nr:hypothetical protein [Cohnella lubricantis]MBB6679617.1 hypothetical protein [Cohnella lubricantis]MBP2120669.1 hypothetical protein [Cohnella lubricantis]
MNTVLNLLAAGGSTAKVAAEGSQLILDKASIFGFLAFCVLFVGFCLLAPAHIYEKYYKTGDDAEPAPEIAADQRRAAS